MALTIKNHSAHYTLILHPESEGGFTVTVPTLPGCVTYGKTLEEARSMAQDAIAGYCISMAKHGETIPTEEYSLITSIELPVPVAYVAAHS